MDPIKMLHMMVSEIQMNIKDELAAMHHTGELPIEAAAIFVPLDAALTTAENQLQALMSAGSTTQS